MSPVAPVRRARCHITVWWFDVDFEARCVRPEGHAGPHRDGVAWWDDHGLRVPHVTDDDSAGVEARGAHGGWKERAGIPRDVDPQVRQATTRRMAGHRRGARPVSP